MVALICVCSTVLVYFRHLLEEVAKARIVLFKARARPHSSESPAAAATTCAPSFLCSGEPRRHVHRNRTASARTQVFLIIPMAIVAKLGAKSLRTAAIDAEEQGDAEDDLDDAWDAQQAAAGGARPLRPPCPRRRRNGTGSL